MISTICGDSVEPIAIAAICGFLLLEAIAWFRPGYRAAFIRWMTFQDPFGLGVWKKYWWVRMGQIVLMIVLALSIQFTTSECG